jgi:type VI secretion system secreted protein VgrG
MGWLPYGDEEDSFAIGFSSGGILDDKITLRGLWGRERLSRLYEFELILERKGAVALTPEQIKGVLGTPCAAAMGPNTSDLVYGIIESIEVLDVSADEPARYYARLVPTVWLLTQARTNRIFQEKSIKTIVTEVLTGYGLKAGTDFEFHLDAPDTKRDYVVQWEESDWDFVQRWLEREGMYYWFEHDSGAKKEKLVIADNAAAATPITGEAQVPHRGYSNLPGEKKTIWDWHQQHRRTSARVALLDYNDQTPTVFIEGKSNVDTEGGFGTVFSYGENLVDGDEAARVAKLRAQRLLCPRDTFSGQTDCARLRVGHTFKFARAQDGELTDYVVTAMEHRVGYPLYGAGSQNLRGYQARFDAITKATQFRPARVTPWPRIDGVLRGHIESTSTKYALLDNQGRYKVRLPFDLSKSKPNMASCWIRLGEPYAGAGYGTHFPLHAGTEVLIAFVQGDPDRPVLVGAVPNPATVSPSIDKNLTESVIRTNSGIHIELEDLQG